MNKKGFSLNMLLPVAMIFVVIGIAMTIGADVGLDIQDDNGGQGAAGSAGIRESDLFNISEQTMVASNTFSRWMSTLALVVVASAIIAIVGTYLAKSY